MRTINEINMVYRNFLWNGSDGLTSHALIRWEDITYPYDEVGLGVRDLLTVNKACILRHVWNIANGKKNILWVHWIGINKIKIKKLGLLLGIKNTSYLHSENSLMWVFNHVGM